MWQTINSTALCRWCSQYILQSD